VSTARTIEILSERTRRPVWRLEIAGCIYSFTSRGTWPAVPFTGAHSGINFTDVACVQAVSALSSSMDPTSAVVEYDPITITLAADFRAPRTLGDPGIVFGAVSDRSATWRGTLLQTAGPADTTIYVDTDPTGLSTPRLIYIGQECISVNGTAGVGTAADPWRFTSCVRGCGGTISQRHVVSSVTGAAPRVLTPEKCSWKGARARLVIAHEFAGSGGAISIPVEWMRGFLPHAPKETGNGVTVTLAPLTALVDQEIGDPDDVIKLRRGYHRFTRGRRCVVQHGQRVEQAGAFNLLVGQSSARNGGRLYGDVQPFDAIYDPTRGDGHPRHGAVVVAGVMAPAQVNATVSGPPSFFNLPAGHPTADVPGFDLSAIGGNRYIVNTASGEIKEQALAPRDIDDATVVRWPDALYDAFAEWQPSDVAGADGAWMDLRLNLSDLQNGPNIEAALNGDEWADGAFLLLGRELYRPSPRMRVWETDQSRSHAVGLALVPFDAFDVADPETGSRDRRIRVPGETAGTANPQVVRVAITGAAEAWYGEGEEGILVEGDVVVPAGGTLFLEATYEGFGLEGTVGWLEKRERTVAFQVVSATSVADPVTATTIGTYLTLDSSLWEVSRIPTFADWPNRRPVEIRRVVEFREQRSATVMLQLLLSDAGEQITSAAYDVLPYGLGLTTSDIDTISFQMFSDPAGLRRWSTRYPTGTKLRDVIEPMLQVTGSQLAMRRNKVGQCRLTRVSTSLETSVEAVGSITDAEMAAPVNGLDDDIITRYEFRTDFDADDEPQRTETLVDTAAAQDQRADATLTLDLRGARLPTGSSAEVLPIFQAIFGRLRQHYGQPRREWTIRVDAGAGLLAEVGQTFLVTSDHLRAYGPTRGVASLPARVVACSVDMEAGVADLALVHHGHQGTGWAPSLSVTSVPSTTSVVVAANEYSETTNPVTGEAQTDLDGFAVGDIVDAVAPGDDDGAATGLEIISIDTATRTVTFDAAHGLTAPTLGDIVPTIYDNAAEAHQALAYIADSAGKLGTADDGGFDVS
jgi:hypothetical protein